MHLLPLLIIMLTIARAMATGSGFLKKFRSNEDKSRGPDAVTEANNILVDALFKERGHLRNVMMANELAESNLPLSKDAKAVLKGFGRLLTVASAHEERPYGCQREEIEFLENMQSLLVKNSYLDPFKQPLYNRRISRLFAQMKNGFVVDCTNEINSRISGYKLVNDENDIDSALQRMTIFKDTFRQLPHLRDNLVLKLASKTGSFHQLEEEDYWLNLRRNLYRRYGEEGLLDEKTGYLVQDYERLKEHLENLFESTCSLIEKNESLRESLELGFQLLVAKQSAPFVRRLNDDRSIIDYKLCIAARQVEVEKILTQSEPSDLSEEEVTGGEEGFE